ncbi:Hypothetical predicted protein, partial [Mytilus galloprovincialis]
METHDKSTYQEFKVDLIQSTILDTDVLDNLISKCILTLDDREEIDSLSDQSNRNQKLLEILMQRPYNTFFVFVEAIKNSDQKCHSSLVERMEAKVLDKDLILQKAQLTDETTVINDAVKLIKWYKTIVHEINIDKTGILDKLFTQDVIDREVHEKLSSVKMVPQEQNRRLLGTLVRKDISSAFPIFLEVLREDSCYKDYAEKIEETHVTQNDLELLSIGNRIRERKRNGMSDLMVDQIEKWKIESKIYVETRATDHVLASINSNNCVSVIGPAGSGKTAIARNVALQMERLGYTILTVSDAKEVKDLYKSDRKTLYVVDDMCGNFTASQSRIEEWKKSMNDIKGILENGNCKLILTCRLQVFQDKGFTNLEIFKTCVCNLRSHSLSLSSEEKKKLTAEYFKEHAVEAFARLSEYEFLPFLCKLYYVQRNNPEFNVQFFLDDPFSFYQKELRSMYNDCAEGKYKYCALLLLVIFNNKLKENHLTGKDPKVEKIIEAIKDVCVIDENIKGRKLKSQLEILTGTFVTYDEGIYKTIHDKLFDFLAVYFGTQEELISILIMYAEPRFVRERFSVTKDIENEFHVIPLSDDNLQMYIQRVFEDMVSSRDVNHNIEENVNLKNIKLRTMLRELMRDLNNQEIIDLLETASTSFLNVMFVMRETDINDEVENRFREYQSFSIILPDDLVQQYIDRWFGDLTKSNSTKAHFKDNRLLKSVTFRIALNSFMRQINHERIGSIIRTGSKDFLDTMFVKTEHDIKDSAKEQYECFGIVIPERILQPYIDRWFHDLTRYSWDTFFDDFVLEKYTSMYFNTAKIWFRGLINFEENRLLMNIPFRDAVRTTMRQLTTEKITSLINTAEDIFLHTMFVLTEDDIIDNAKKTYKQFGIIIPDDLLQQYIEQYFNRLTNTNWMVALMNKNRAFQNDKGRTALRSYMKQLTKEKIASLIQNAGHIFFKTMFVMTEEDIKDNAKNRYECFGIVIPDDLIKQYVQRWFDQMTNERRFGDAFYRSRLIFNVSFRCTLRNCMRQLPTEKIALIIQTSKNDVFNQMFVMTEDDIKDNAENQYECFGIVVSVDLLQQYIHKWLKCLTYTSDLEKCIDENRLFKNSAFRTALCNYMRQLDKETIASLISDAGEDVLNKMFVMTDEDIIDSAENQHKCFGIVIPDHLLQHYFDIWLKRLTKTSGIEKCIDENRPLKNDTFRTALCDHMRQLNTEKIAHLIRNAKNDFLNKMFVMSEDDIKDNTEKRYECFGIVIPANLIKAYIERWLKRLTKTDELQKSIDQNRPQKNALFRNAFQTYMEQSNAETIANLIWIGSTDFLNTMFVMTTDEIKDNFETRYTCVGIEIPQDVLHQYIEKWVEGLTVTSDLEKFIDKNRPLKTAKFRIALCNYLKQLNQKKIASLILEVDGNYLNKMFVMTEDDINENAVNLYERFGIVIPDEMLQQYIERWFLHLFDRPQTKSFLDGNRLLMNATFCTAFRNFIKQLNREQIAYFIQKGSKDFINTMFVMTEDDIKDDGANRYEWFGIVIPDDLLLLQQYIERWFKSVTEANSVKVYMNANRLLTNATFRTALHTYMSLLDTDEIESLIRTGSSDFLNTMFVLMENDIVSEHAYYRFESFGIVIPDDMLQQYIERWMDCMKKTNSVMEFVGVNRSSMSNILQTELEPYMTE